MNELWNFDQGTLVEVKAVCDVLFRHLKHRPLYYINNGNNQGQIPNFNLDTDTDLDLLSQDASVDRLYELLHTILHYLSTHSETEYQILYQLVQSLASKLSHSYETHKLLEQENKTLLKLIKCNSNTTTPNISPHLVPVAKTGTSSPPVNTVNNLLQSTPIAIKTNKKPISNYSNNRSVDASPNAKTKPVAAEDMIKPTLHRVNTSSSKRIQQNYWKSLNDVGKSASVSGYPSPKSISPTKLSSNFRSPKAELLSFQH